MKELYLGIDTSNYKTSISAINLNNDIIFNSSEFLDVKLGERGLRQSDAFFQQSNKLPFFIDELFKYIKAEEIAAIGVSTRPRRVEGSYMPCFLAGYNLAKELSAALKVPVYEFSHQEGHAAAVIDEDVDKCLFFHLSGGTTEFLLCEKDEQGYNMEIVGGTKDISIGQLIDRIGVEMGLNFPSGMYLDEIAGNSSSSTDAKKLIPGFNLKDGYFNLSGIETKLIRYIQSVPSEDDLNSMVTELFIRIAALLYSSAKSLAEKYKIDEVIMSGGVASSLTIRKYISELDTGGLISFGAPELSGDNAVGIATLTNRRSKLESI